MTHPNAPHIIGLIADTHGLVRPDVFRALAGVELILHAGDVGGDDILDELSLIAPVRAVFGNTDPPGNPALSASIDTTFDAVTVHVSHGHETGAPTPARLLERYSADVIVYGHTHKQLVATVDGRWVVNPGAAGPRRFDLTPSVARLTIAGREIKVDIIDLAI
jgi:putative phosphoesterase